jgi:hypothetical protein
MKRPVVLVATWLLAAGIAVGLGFLAVSFVSASPSSASLLAAASTTEDRSADSTATPSAAASPGTSARQVTAGGTVLATCAGGVARLAGAPASGWRIDDSAEAGTVEFRSGTQSVEVRADCSTGTPVFAVEGPRTSGGGSDDGTIATTPAATTSAASATADDHGSGGQGADDPAGDDRGNGGHGADG